MEYYDIQINQIKKKDIYDNNEKDIRQKTEVKSWRAGQLMGDFLLSQRQCAATPF